MAGQIIAKGKNTWLVRIFQGRDTNGQRHYFNKTIRGTKKDAQKWLNAALRDKDLGAFIEPAAMSLNDYLDKWLETAAKPRLTERTFTDYRDTLKRYVRPKLGRQRLADLRPLDIQSLYSEMQANGLTPRTVRVTHVILSSALKQAVRWQMLSHNPAQDAELPKRVRKEMAVLSQTEAARFMGEARADEHYIVFAFALATGARPSEYLALKWSDIDLSKGTATIQRTLYHRSAKNGGWCFAGTKTPSSRRTLPLPQSLVKEMRQHRIRQAERRLQLGGAYQAHDLVFATALGGPLLASNLNTRNFHNLKKRAALPARATLYTLRHTCATLLLLAGESPKVVAERLGHSSITMTLDTYSHVLPSMQQAAAERLEKLLYGT